MSELKDLLGGTSNKSVAYRDTIKMLIRLLGDNWLIALINYPKRSISNIEKYYTNINSLMSHFSRITKLLKLYKKEGKNINEDVINMYEDKMNDYTTKSRDQREENLKSDIEKEKWISWDKIIKLREKLKNKIRDWETFQNYLILCLYTYLPPIRADYGNMLYKNKFNEKLIGSKNNYVIVDGKNSEFILNSYKTSKSHGTVRIAIPAQLLRIIEIWFKKYNTDKNFLLVMPNGNKLTNKYLAVKVKKIFMDNTGKNTGVSTLRHIYISEHMNDANISVKLRRKIANLMTHSVKEQLLYMKMDDD